MSLAGTKSQRAAILRLLLDARGSWVALPEILALGIAQYGARILELRRQGFTIENRTEHVDGERHSWFRLIKCPPQAAPVPVRHLAETDFMRRRRLEDERAAPLFAGAQP